MALRLGILAVAAIAVVGITIALAAPKGSFHDTSSSSTASAAPVRELAGVPQNGIALGSPKAPLTMSEFADPQCPFCAQYHNDVFPTLLARYVKAGKLRIEMNVLRFLGPDSEKLALVAAGAAEKNRLWDVLGLAYARQGAENSGYATNAFVKGLLTDAGLRSVDTGPGARRLLQQAETRAQKANIQGTPSFLIGPTGGTLHRFEPSSLTPEPFVAQIDKELGR